MRGVLSMLGYRIIRRVIYSYRPSGEVLLLISLKLAASSDVIDVWLSLEIVF